MRMPQAFPALIIVALGLPAQAAAPASGDELGWMAGAWCGGAGGEAIEETWLPPVGGLLVGLSRTVRGGRSVGYEYMRIERVDGVPTFFAQPGGKPPTAFPAVEAGERHVRFANGHHDFPQWIEYRREGERLLAAIGGPGGDGKPLRIDFSYAACPSAAA